MPDVEASRGREARRFRPVPLAFAILLLLALVVMLIAACGKEEAAPEATLTPAQEAAAATLKASEIVHVSLGEFGGSGQTGIATLTGKGDRTEVVIRVSPGPAGADVPQPAHIRSADCQSLGPEIARLENVVNGHSTSLVFSALGTLLAGGLSIKVHKSEEESATYTACGEVPTRDKFLTVILSPRGSAGRSGSATLTDVANLAQVLIRMEGLVEEHVASIHLGSCKDLSRITAFALSKVADGTSVSTVRSALLGLKSRGLFIDVHPVDEGSPPIACGDIAPP